MIGKHFFSDKVSSAFAFNSNVIADFVKYIDDKCTRAIICTDDHSEMVYAANIESIDTCFCVNARHKNGARYEIDLIDIKTKESYLHIRCKMKAFANVNNIEKRTNGFYDAVREQIIERTRNAYVKDALSRVGLIQPVLNHVLDLSSMLDYVMEKNPIASHREIYSVLKNKSAFILGAATLNSEKNAVHFALYPNLKEQKMYLRANGDDTRDFALIDIEELAKSSSLYRFNYIAYRYCFADAFKVCAL